MTEMQKQFEEWALSQKWCINKTGDTYNNTYVGCSWQAWQASRAEIVVKLPVKFPENDDKDSAEVVYILDILEQLALAGVRYE